VVLPDGDVLLVGGCSRAKLDVGGSLRPLLRPMPDSLVEGASRLYLEDMRLASIGSQSVLRRAGAPAVLLPAGQVLMAGGRTSQVRSQDLVLGMPGQGVTLQWLLDSADLTAARFGAQAVALGEMVVVAGGQESGQDAIEIIQVHDDSVQVFAASLTEPVLANPVGHSLNLMPQSVGTSKLLLAGGISTASGSLPDDRMWTLSLQGTNRLSVSPHALSHPRAYHAAIWLEGGQAGGQSVGVLLGGLNEALQSSSDLETVSASGVTTLLDQHLETGSLGLAVAILPDSSALLVGGLDVDESSQVSLSSTMQILSP
jgi:hypothetical protein